MDLRDLRSEPLRHRSAERTLQAEDLLSVAFERGGWSVEHLHSDLGADLVVRRQGTAYVVQLKVGAEGRPDRLIPLLAQAVLEARSAAASGLRPLAVVAAPRIAPRAAKQILRFAHEYAPGVAVGVLDFEGLRLFAGPDLESLVAPLPHSPALASRLPQPEPVHLFTDLNQWMLKVLLAPELPSQLLSAPRGDYRNASELARAAGVSVMTAYRLVELLKSEGFLHESEPCLRLVRRKALFSRWQASAQRSTHEEPQRFVLRGDASVTAREAPEGPGPGLPRALCGRAGAQPRSCGGCPTLCLRRAPPPRQPKPLEGAQAVPSR